MQGTMPFEHWMGGEPLQEFRAEAGAPLEPGSSIAPHGNLIAALKTVYDPEIPVDIYELGLIYDLEQSEDGSVRVEMSLTAPGCPVAGEMPGMVADAVAGVQGVGEVEVRLVWEPAWTMERMSEEARLALDMW